MQTKKIVSPVTHPSCAHILQTLHSTQSPLTDLLYASLQIIQYHSSHLESESEHKTFFLLFLLHFYFLLIYLYLSPFSSLYFYLFNLFSVFSSSFLHIPFVKPPFKEYPSKQQIFSCVCLLYLFFVVVPLAKV